MWLGIDNLIFFKALNGIFLLLSSWGLFYLVQKITKQKSLAFVALTISLFSPQIIHFSNIVMTEMFYLFNTVICFYSLYKYSEKNSSKFWKSPYFYIAIVSTAISYHTRTVGSTLIFAIIAFFLFRKEWKAALASAGSIVLLLLPWSIRNNSDGLESRYLGTIMTINPWRPEEGSVTSVSGMIHKMLLNFDEVLIKGMKEILFPFVSVNYEETSGILAIILGLIVLGVLIYGAWNLGKLKWFFIAYLIANFGLLLLWHGGNGSRYLVTIGPLLFVLFYTGIYFIVCNLFKLKENVASKIPYAFLGIILFMIPPIKIYAEMVKKPYDPAYQNYFEIAKIVEEKAPKNTIVCCRKPELFLYYSPSSLSTRYIYSADSKVLISDLVNKKVEYVVLEQLGFGSTYRYLFPVIQQNPELFTVLMHLYEPDTFLLKFERNKAIEKFGLNEK